MYHKNHNVSLLSISERNESRPRISGRKEMREEEEKGRFRPISQTPIRENKASRNSLVPLELSQTPLSTSATQVCLVYFYSNK